MVTVPLWIKVKSAQKSRKIYLLLALFLAFSGSSDAQAPDFAWASQSHGYSGLSDGIGRAIAHDNAGNTYITGSFTASIHIGSITLTSKGADDIFIVKYNAAGNLVWVRSAGGTGKDFGYDIGVDGMGNCYVTGSFGGDEGPTAFGGTGFSLVSADFGGIILNTTGAADVFLAKYDAAGNAVWAQKGGSIGIDYANALAVNTNGECYITGAYHNAATFGSFTLPNPLGFNRDMFRAKYDAAGNIIWIFGHGNLGQDIGHGVAIDAAGNSYVTGEFGTSIAFGTTTLTGDGSPELFVGKFDATGNPVWVERAGGANSDAGSDIGVDAAGNCYVAGNVNDGTFGATPFTGSLGVAKYNSAGILQWVYPSFTSEYGLAVDAAGNSYFVGHFANSISFGSATLTGGGHFLAKVNSAGSAVWAVKTGEHAHWANDVAIDATGNSYITGRFNGNFTIAGTVLTNTTGVETYTAKFNTTGTGLWVTAFSVSTSTTFGNAIARDGQGNTYVTGYFNRSTTFGNTTLTVITGPGGTGAGTNIFVVKYDPSGNVLWARKAGGGGGAYGYGIAADSAGNCYVTGTIISNSTFGDTTVNTTTGNNLFIAKYDAAGNVLWVQTAGGPGTERPNSIALDAAGNSYITGYFSSSATFGNITLPQGGGTDIFIAKYDNAGNVLWAKKAGGANSDAANGIAIDAAGNSYITGYFSSTATFDALSVTSNSTSSLNIFTAKYDAAGNAVWVKKAGGTSSHGDIGQAIAVDNSGNTYVTGKIYDAASFGSISFPVTNQFHDIFLMKYNSLGNEVWARKIPSSVGYPSSGGYDTGTGIQTDNAGNIYLTGYFSGDVPDGYFSSHTGAVTFGATTLNSSGGADIFLAKYDAAGNAVWAKNAGGTGEDYSRGIALDAQGNSYLTGSFWGSADFGATTLSSLGNDVFIGKVYNNLNPEIITTGNISPASFCQGGTVNVPYTATGTFGAGNIFTAQLSDSGGLFINPIAIGTLAATTSGTITATIPGNAIGGANYRIRVIASDPAIYGTDNGAGLTINAAIAAAPAGLVCIGSGGVLLTASNGTGYFWSAGEGLATQTGDTVVANPLIPGTHTYTVSGTSNGCPSTSQVTILAAPTPIVTIDAPAEICAPNGTGTLTASGATTYSWSTGSANAAITVGPNFTATYSVTGTTQGCSATESVTLTVYQTPNIFLQPQFICTGDSVTLQAFSATVYTWSTGQTGSAITVSPDSTTTYSVTGFNGSCAGTGTVAVNINPLPDVVFTSPAAPICAGVTTSLTASGAHSYSWNGAGWPSYVHTVSPAVTTTYTVTATSMHGCVDTAQVTVLVDPVPQIATISASPQVVAPGGQVTLSFTENNPIPGAVYQWTGPDLNQQAGNLVTANPVAAGQATYTLTAISGACSTSDTLSVFVDPALSSTENGFFAGSLSVYPNPFQNSFKINFTSTSTKAEVMLTDVLGRQIFNKTYQTQTGETTLQIQPKTQLSQGLYLLQIKQDNQTQTIRIIKQ